MLLSLALSFVLLTVRSEVYFSEDFNSLSRWTKSKKSSDLGDMQLVQLKGVTEGDNGFKTTQDSRFYHYSSPLDSAFATKGKDLYFEFTLRHEQELSCGGGYLKLLLADYGKSFHGESGYAIMFGPDVCGSEKKIHLIFSIGANNVPKISEISYDLDNKTHVYSLIVGKDKSYDVLVDGKSKASGKIVDDFELFGAKEIDDPEDKKPSDWVDNDEIPDPKATKPEDWDKPEFITDEEAKKPEDWNDVDDGEWTPPTKPNPDYKGEWSAPMISNPDYKGPFVPKKIPNPVYKYDDTYCEYTIKGVGIDLWQVQSGSIFDRIYLSDDLEEAAKYRSESLEQAEQQDKTSEKDDKAEYKSEDL